MIFDCSHHRWAIANHQSKIENLRGGKLMPLPIFPAEAGTPGDGSLIAIHGGSPASTEVVGGLIQLAQAVEMYPQLGTVFPSPDPRSPEPLLGDGVTLWIQGSLLLNVQGEPAVTDYADMLSRWTTIRDKLLLSNYELFLYYHPASPTTYRKYKTVNTYLVRSFWNNPAGMSYIFAAVSTDRTLYTTGPGL
jgi:hypothetical protein